MSYAPNSGVCLLTRLYGTFFPIGTGFSVLLGSYTVNLGRLRDRLTIHLRQSNFQLVPSRP